MLHEFIDSFQASHSYPLKDNTFLSVLEGPWKDYAYTTFLGYSAPKVRCLVANLPKQTRGR